MRRAKLEECIKLLPSVLVDLVFLYSELTEPDKWQIIFNRLCAGQPHKDVIQYFVEMGSGFTGIRWGAQPAGCFVLKEARHVEYLSKDLISPLLRWLDTTNWPEFCTIYVAREQSMHSQGMYLHFRGENHLCCFIDYLPARPSFYEPHFLSCESTDVGFPAIFETAKRRWDEALFFRSAQYRCIRKITG